MQTSYRQMVVMRGLFRYISCMHSSSYNHNTLTTLITCEGIGVGTGGAGPPPPPIFYPRDFINIHTCSADRRDRGVYYVRPPQNGITSYAYGGNYLVALRPWKFLTATLKCIFTDVHAYMHMYSYTLGLYTTVLISRSY